MANSLQKLQNAVESFLPDKFLYFRKKYINLDFFRWGKPRKNMGSYLHLAPPIEFRLFDMEEQLGIDVVKWFKDCYLRYKVADGFLNTYILKCNNCIIEPSTGWGIDKKSSKLIFNSLANNGWKEEFYPSFGSYISSSKKTTTLKEVVSIRMIRGGEDNYWHFLHDILGQVVLAQENDLVKMPLLISKNLSEKPYFKNALTQSSFLRQLLWVVQDADEYIETETVYFIQAGPHQPANFHGLIKLLEVPQPVEVTARRIFLTRISKRGRYLENSKEAEAIALKYGFEIVDTESLSFKQQITLFSETRFIVGIHGAGLINIIFRQLAPLSVFEIFPADYIPPHYFWLSKDFGHDYVCQVGNAMNETGGFYLDTGIFEQKIKELLSK